MKFLIDQDVYAITIRLLREWGHDVITAASLNLSRAPDRVLLTTAKQQGRILITRDKDYGALVFLEHRACGVVLLRIIPSTLDAVHQQLKHVLNIYAEDQIAGAFIVVEARQHRFRKIPHTN